MSPSHSNALIENWVKREGRLIRLTGGTRSREPGRAGSSRACGPAGGSSPVRTYSLYLGSDRQKHERAVSDGISGAKDPDAMARRPPATETSWPLAELLSFRLDKQSCA